MTASCKACNAPTSPLLAFCDTCRDSGNDRRWHAEHPPLQFEHAPGHPYGVQPGPGGLSARFCLRADCDWRDTVGGGA